MEVKLNLDKRVVFRLLEDSGTFATVLHVIVLSSYGENFYNQDVLETITQLEEDFNVRIPVDNENKLNAILLAVTTDAVEEDPESFRGVAETFSNGDPGIGMMDQLTIPEILWAFYELELNREQLDLTPRVMKYLKPVLDNEVLGSEDDFVEDVYQYVWDYMQDQHQTLQNQMLELGIPISDIPPIANPVYLQK